MILGKVVGTVVATRKEPELDGLRMLVVQDLDSAGKATGKTIVAIDAMDAGIGEVVLYCAGSAARQTEATKNRPVDHVIMAIVDTVEVGEKTLYDKSVDG